jgi:hypothetical protein
VNVYTPIFLLELVEVIVGYCAALHLGFSLITAISVGCTHSFICSHNKQSRVNGFCIESYKIGMLLSTLLVAVIISRAYAQYAYICPVNWLVVAYVLGSVSILSEL